ncbi:MAG: magnesium transporter [Paracoccaceae bacterium]|nr:magnesium transporter [Paracoccaceae bacterium]
MKQTWDSSATETGRGTDAYALDCKAVAAILYAVDIKDQSRLLALIAPLRPADIADLLEQINAFERRRLIDLYGGEFDSDILSEIDERIREEVIATLHPGILVEAVRNLESDEVVDLLEDLQEPQINIILKALAEPNRLAVEKSLTYPEFSVSRLMQCEVVMAPKYSTVGEAADFRRNAKRLPDQFYHVTLVNPKLQPLANVTLGKLLSTRRDVALTAILEEVFLVIPVLQDEADVAYAFNQYLLISAPVVDESNRLIGLITIDDAMAMLEHENEEDILQLARVTASNLSDRVLETTKQRLPWLAVNLTPSNLWRVVCREAFFGLLNGVVFAVVMGGVGLIWFSSSALGYGIVAAMVINLIVAVLAGTLVPVVLDRFGFDPALGSEAFVTTITDMVGFFAFLGLAAWLLV